MKVKFLQTKESLNLNSEGTELEKKSLEELRKKYEKFYAVTDEKYNKDNFEKKVSRRLID